MLASGLQPPASPSANAEPNAEPALLPLSAELAAADAGARANGCALRSFHAVCVAIRPLGRSDGTAGAGVMITLADEPSAIPDGIADDFSWYRALIKQTVQAKWKKPPIPAGEKIVTEVSIRIAPDGTVTFLNLSKPSGDAAMDTSVEAAVRAAAKIPRPLPPGLGTPDYTVIIQFKLE